MTTQIVRKTLAAAVAVALVAGSTLSAAEAKDGRRTAAIVGALVGIAGVLVDAHANRSDAGYRPARYGRIDGHGFHNAGFGKGKFEKSKFEKTGFGKGSFGKGLGKSGFTNAGFDKGGFKKIGLKNASFGNGPFGRF